MFRKKQTLGFRLWHWVNSVLFILILLTVLARKTFLNIKANAAAIIVKGQESGLVITEQQARDIARMIRNPVWQWHAIIGLVIFGLLFVRLFLYIKEKQNPTSQISKRPLHYRLVKNNYILFYVLLVVMSLTGILLNYHEFFNISKGVEDFVEDIHKIVMWYFPVFIIFHIAGVIIADRGEDKGLVSDMIHGGDE